jgi:hypothetical protein
LEGKRDVDISGSRMALSAWQRLPYGAFGSSFYQAICRLCRPGDSYTYFYKHDDCHYARTDFLEAKKAALTTWDARLRLLVGAPALPTNAKCDLRAMAAIAAE